MMGMGVCLGINPIALNSLNRSHNSLDYIVSYSFMLLVDSRLIYLSVASFIS